MKKVTREYEVYSFDELSPEAKDYARNKWNEYDDLPFLQADLREYIHEELIEKGYTHDEITPFYDLSYNQGSGLMFEGTVTDKKGNRYTIKHSGHYYHEKSTNITGYDKNDNEIDIEKWEKEVYIPICKKIRDMGYDEIEHAQSEEAFAETCEANEYNFLSDGKMVNY